METIKFIDNVIQSNDEEFKFAHEKQTIKPRDTCYSYTNIFECFDKIVNLFKNYDPNTKSNFTAFLDCYRHRNHFHDPLIIFPLKQNKMEKYKQNIFNCYIHHLLIVEWENYLKSKEIKELPFKLINLCNSIDLTAKIMDPDDIALIFSVDRFYKDR